MGVGVWGWEWGWESGVVCIESREGSEVWGVGG